jgi:DNA-binding NtrC family response regulator
MTGQRVWLRCGADFPLEARDTLVAQLGRFDIAVDPTVEGPGVLLFGAPDEAVHRMLDEIRQRQASRALAVAAHAGSLSSECAWALLRAGAQDILAWDACAQPAASVVLRLRRWLEIDTLLASPVVSERLRGRSRALLAVLCPAVEAARFGDGAVLITGETGTGKELLARMIHDLDPRVSPNRFEVCDCTTIVPELSGSEFFGHERGAFTGAVRARDGAFAQADGGTLFLDEIGELPLRLQAELLRVIQEGTYKRVGSNQWLHTRFRLVCATHRDLTAEIEAGRFREDLYYRIAGCVLHMPSLEARREDIPLLVAAFLAEVLGEAPPALDPPVRDYLLARRYPGNVRELRQLVLRIAQRHVSPGPITLGALPESELAAALGSLPGGWPDGAWEQAVRVALARGQGLAELRHAVAEVAYQIVLAEEGGDTGRSARRLQVSQRAVQQYLHGHGVSESTNATARHEQLGAPRA